MAERFPSWKQALITFFGGIVLAGTSCFGFILTLSGANLEHGGGSDPLSIVAAVVFFVSLIVILVGFIFVIMRLVRAMMEKKPGQPQDQGGTGAPM